MGSSYSITRWCFSSLDVKKGGMAEYMGWWAVVQGMSIHTRHMGRQSRPAHVESQENCGGRIEKEQPPMERGHQTITNRIATTVSSSPTSSPMFFPDSYLFSLISLVLLQFRVIPLPNIQLLAIHYSGCKHKLG
jgi:hypothetical protein